MSTDKKIATPTDEEIGAYGGETAEGAPPAKSEAEEWKDKFLRAKADLSNYQKRAEKERVDAHRFAISELARALLPLVDDLERVVAAGSDSSAKIEPLVEAAQLTRDHFMKVLNEFHISPIEAEGQAFDPQIHEAVMEQPSEHPGRTVLQEVAKGYRLFDRVLRPAKVIVSKPASEA